jgi:spore germination cell wall hydrolase CwlJ-like protein
MNPRAQIAVAKPEGSRLARWPVFASLLSLASCFALSGTAGPVHPVRSAPESDVRISLEPGAEPAVMTFQAVDAEKAVEMNAAVPNDSGPILPASAFRTSYGDDGIGTRMTALECLTSAIYYEASSESSEGQRAVAQVVLNRVRHPAFPHSVCGVVFQGAERTTGCQFTFTCDGSLARQRNPQSWRRAMSVAAAALAGYVERSVGTATHYHTVWVVPYWQSSLTKITTVGAHVFYRWTGSWGTPAAFSATYAGIEMLPNKLAMLGDPTGELGLMAANGGPDGAGIESYEPPQPVYGPRTAQIEAPPRTPLAADESQGSLLADERHGVLLLN